ncbi:hypothetical protein E2C01_022764 [Portunus trituberculatus]|uniref:Uncharacterized protein n=1 Tax=Portunus trituberculatus TaxID=210409 RepID=A0A5B7E857_PORTR|nr:hypothetical protein [Portunus trituberculatus]
MCFIPSSSFPAQRQDTEAACLHQCSVYVPPSESRVGQDDALRCAAAQPQSAAASPHSLNGPQ